MHAEFESKCFIRLVQRFSTFLQCRNFTQSTHATQFVLPVQLFKKIRVTVAYRVKKFPILPYTHPPTSSSSITSPPTYLCVLPFIHNSPSLITSLITSHLSVTSAAFKPCLTLKLLPLLLHLSSILYVNTVTLLSLTLNPPKLSIYNSSKIH